MAFAFLFDNDGVLIDSSELHWQAWVKLMQKEPELQFTKDHFLKTFGKRNDLILQELAPNVSAEKRKKWAEEKEGYFREIAKNNISLIPGIEPFLQEIQSANISRIIASSTPVENLKLFLSSTILGKYFDAFVSGEEVAHGKPAPDVFIEAARRLGYISKNTIVIEDAPAGIDAGKKAGAFVIALATTHSKEELKNYDLIYNSPFDLKLPEIIQKYTLWRSKQTPWHYFFLFLRKLVGILLIVIGIASSPIPIFPGFIFILVGLYLFNAKLINKYANKSSFLKKVKNKLFKNLDK